MPAEWNRGVHGEHVPRRLVLPTGHVFPKGSYWARGVPLETVERSVRNSLCFGIYRGEEQVGFARVTIDYATFTHVADVFVPEEHCGRGLGPWLMEIVISHPELKGLRRSMLATAHGPYCR